jgi:hypothetical protein
LRLNATADAESLAAPAALSRFGQGDRSTALAGPILLDALTVVAHLKRRLRAVRRFHDDVTA